jgi:hypothetical protein
MASGTDCNCMDAGLHHQKLECDERNDVEKYTERDGAHLNCRVTKEKTRTRALESTNTTSSFPHTNDTCTIDISVWLYHGMRLIALPCPWSVLKVSSKTNE